MARSSRRPKPARSRSAGEPVERKRAGASARLDVEERRRQLIVLGRKLFSEHAYDDLSTNELSKRAGVSAGLLYHYFKNKRGYYVETIRDVAREVREKTEPARDAPFDQALLAALTSFVDFVAHNGKLYRALVRGGIGSDREVNEILEGLRQTNAGRVVAQLGIKRPSRQLLCAIYGWIGYVEFACLWWADHRGFSREQLIEQLIAAMTPVLEQVRDR